MQTLFFFSIVILTVVFFHELGHFLFARLFKMKVETFSVGMGPELISRKDKHGTVWRLALFPLGGYVKVLDGEATRNKAGSFDSRPIYQRIIMVFAGPVFSVLLGWLLFLVVFGVWGKPVATDFTKTGIHSVVSNSPASKSGLQQGDVITSIKTINKTFKIEEFINIHTALQNAKNSEVKLTVKRDNNIITTKLTPRVFSNENGQIYYQMGIIIAPPLYKSLSVLEILKMSNELTVVMLGAIYNGITEMLSGDVKKDSFGGPIKIAEMSGQSANAGLRYFLGFISMLSINLGVLNLLPIPILDGGRIILLLGEAILRRPLSRQFINTIMTASLLIMLSVFIYVTLMDLGIV